MSNKEAINYCLCHVGPQHGVRGGPGGRPGRHLSSLGRQSGKWSVPGGMQLPGRQIDST